MNESVATNLPVVVIGAGPIGLAAAAQLRLRGLEAIVLESGPSVATHVREWGHVRLFSPWRYLVDGPSRELLEADGWTAPDPDAHPTGNELVASLLEPLASHAAIAPMLRFGHRVTAVTRLGYDRMKTPGRTEAPFLVVADGPDGEVRIRARAVMDASGTWSQPNPIGSGGVPAAGESANADRIRYGTPDVLGRERARYEGKRVLVVGSGHSAFHAALDLAALAEASPGTHVTWAVRREDLGQMFGGGAADALSARGALGARAEALAASPGTAFVTAFRVDRIERSGDALAVVAEDERRVEVDEIVATTGYRPDLSIARELRLDLDPVTEAPALLAPLIDPNVHSCGTVPPHGQAELAHPDAGFYAVGMKSYGRAPTFLLLTGYEQVRSVAAYLAGDFEAAARVELELPETGVCSADVGGVPCCGPVAVERNPEPVGVEPQPETVAADQWAEPSTASRGPELAVVGGGGSGCCG